MDLIVCHYQTTNTHTQEILSLSLSIFFHSWRAFSSKTTDSLRECACILSLPSLHLFFSLFYSCFKRPCAVYFFFLSFSIEQSCFVLPSTTCMYRVFFLKTTIFIAPIFLYYFLRTFLVVAIVFSVFFGPTTSFICSEINKTTLKILFLPFLPKKVSSQTSLFLSLRVYFLCNNFLIVTFCVCVRANQYICYVQKLYSYVQ